MAIGKKVQIVESDAPEGARGPFDGEIIGYDGRTPIVLYVHPVYGRIEALVGALGIKMITEETRNVPKEL